MKSKRVISLLLIVTVLFTVMSVSVFATTDSSVTEPQETLPQQESTSVSETIEETLTVTPDKLNMETKAVTKLTAQSNTEESENQIIVWLSTNTKVATVKDGKVTAKALGKTTVTGEFNGISDSCQVTVNKTSVQTILGRNLSLLSLVKNIENYKNGTWKTSDKKVATVDSKGKLKEKTAGSCNITYKAPDKTKYTITVKIKKVSLNKASVNLYHKGSETLKLKNATGDIKWSTSNQKVAKVSSKGKVKAVSRGKATIIATYLGVKFKCAVRVYGKKLVAITFDDGPSIYTETILNTFKKYDSKATFFVVGNRLSGNKKILQRMKKEGHEIGNHTFSHPQLTVIGTSGITTQLKKTSDKITAMTGNKVTLMRPPYGACNQQVKTKAKEMGLAIINWSVDTLDWKTRDKNYVSSVIMNQAKNGKIVLCHDLYYSTAEAMKIVVPKLVKQGYDLVTVTELLESENGKAKAGEVYFNR